MTYFYILGPPLYLWNPKVRDFKFGVRIGRQARKPKSAKLGQKGRCLRHVAYFYNFETPAIYLERMKLETSNLMCGLNARPVTQQYAKVGQKGRGLRHVTFF